ncbi:protein bride of sevenless [Episyrphus balteatus]|uniref:protein bride of sevenless n=1 Tax=Episyrphus balteatus TaxID=286459 RepID=UPI0024850B1D|nr:protein bride of sevenless [Episyrphus balteatus]
MQINICWNPQRAIIWLLISMILHTSTAGPGKKTPAKLKTTTTSTTTEPSSTTPLSSTVPAIPLICVEGIRSGIEDENKSQSGESFVQVIEGDAMLSVMTRDPITAIFVLNRINQANLIGADFEIGIRAIEIKDSELAENILLQEVQYLQQCVDHSIGLFIDVDIYNILEHVIDDLEYYIWPIPSARGLVFPKVAHLLYQMPWGEKIASVEILAENLNVYNDFMDAARKEHLCLMHFRSSDNIYIVFGNKMITNFHENGTIFVIPNGRTTKSFIAGLPNKSYLLMESEIDLRVIDENSTQITIEENLIGQSIIPSNLLAFAGPILDLTRWINDSLVKNCKNDHGAYLLETCPDFLTFVEDWDTEKHVYDSMKVLEQLKLNRLGHMMNFEMFQKTETKANITNEKITDLREIASQNFITNVTTYYHYNNGNDTRHEMKSKFGQVFNCQYVDGNNKRYPFLFDGESVMFWRIKPDPWIAAGMTAAALGVLISLAILVFIITRISLGDVFEGNPVTSILLLLSLVLLFSSYVPFSMEYASDHRNSHVTFEDASTLNTLCAIRVFILTLSYCMTFSLLLCRALMLASIGSEGGFLSHVNGYIQGVICIFSTLVQVGMSTQLIIVMHIANESVSCENMYYGNWLWALLAYDFILLVFLVCMIPFVYRSQRNYREGILLVIGAILIFIIWCTWITMSFFGDEWRDAALAMGLQATGWAILTGIMIPRTFLIVRGIERSDIAQALPSLTSLAFAQNNQYSSEQSVYECVNPAMRNCSSREDGMCEVGHMRQSQSDIPTLPLRGGVARRQQFFNNIRQQNQQNQRGAPPPRRPISPTASSQQSSLPPSPENNKITRF